MYLKDIKRVLILGGTEFMGRATVERFLQYQPQPEITILNRGNKYWSVCIALDQLCIKIYRQQIHGEKELNVLYHSKNIYVLQVYLHIFVTEMNVSNSQTF
jgi:hypothetical protein